MTAWTDDELLTLRHEWPRKSAGQIATMLGRTRSSVMGKAKRLGLIGIEKTLDTGRKTGGRPQAKRPRRAAPQFRPKPSLPPVEPPPPPPPEGISILDIKPNQCRAVVGYDANGLAMFCGEPFPIGQPFSFCPKKHLHQYTTSSAYRGGFYGVSGGLNPKGQRNS